MNIVLNGNLLCTKEVNVKALLRSYKVDTTHCAVAINGEVVEKQMYEKYPLNEGDKIEVVQPVGGG